MVVHTMTLYGQAAEALRSWNTSNTGEEPQIYRMALTAKGVPQSCLVEVCLGRVATRMAMQVHFLYLYVLDTMVILEEVNLPHPRCT